MDKINYNIEDYLHDEGGKFNINWKKVASTKREHFHFNIRRYERFNDELVKKLKEKGILVNKWKKESYYIAGDGVIGGHIGPRYSNGVRLNFNYLNDAERYLENAQWLSQNHQIYTKVLSHDETVFQKPHDLELQISYKTISQTFLLTIYQ